MGLEQDRVEVVSGVRAGHTLGSPIAMLVLNAEYEKWREVMAVEGDATGGGGDRAAGRDTPTSRAP